MKQEAIIIYMSIYNGNTKKIARSMSQKLGCSFITAQEAIDKDLSKYEVVGLGSGIYFGTHHPALFKVVEKLNRSAQKVFVFSSRGAPILGKYHYGLKHELLQKGKNILGEFSVKGYDETGPWVIIGGGNIGRPNETDLKKAEKFIQKILPEYCLPDYYKKVENISPITEGSVNTYILNVNSSSVVLKGDMVTVNQTACLGCGKCIKVCPLNVIELIEKKATPTKELDCTLCRLCIQNCRARAINLHYTWSDAINVAKRHSKRVRL